MEYKTLMLETENHVCKMTLNRPPVNAVNLELRTDLERSLTEIENDRDIWVLVITGSGDKAFSAGMDLKDVANIRKEPSGSEIMTKVDRFPKPVIAAINGFAFGRGFELAMASHFRFMTDSSDAQLGFTEVDLGIIPGWGGTQRLPRLIGRAKAMEMIFFSQRITASEAKEIGLVDRVCKSDRLMDEAMEFASRLAQRPPIAISCILKSISTGLDEGIDEGLKVEREGIIATAKSEDSNEGISAFLEKRKPVFKGV